MKALFPCMVCCLIVVAVPVCPEAVAVECYTPLAWQPKLADTPLDTNENYIDDALDDLSPGEFPDVIVCLNRCPEDDDLARLQLYGQVWFQSHYVSLVTLLNVPEHLLESLAQEEFVAFVEADHEVWPALDVSNPAIRVRASEEYSPDTVEDQYPDLGGNGVNIAIVDSGVDDGVHESLPAWKYVAGVDCTVDPCDDTVNPDDTLGHGTHVAGIAMGTGGPSGTYAGIAPGANLVDVKVFYSVPDDTKWLLRGLEEVLDNHEDWNIDVVNMSWGDCTASNGTDAKSAMANRMVSRGMVVVASAGNTFECELPLGTSLVASPAAADDVISVGNSRDMDTITRDDDWMNSSSLRGPRASDGDGDSEDEEKPDLVAPGSVVRSAENDTVSGYVNHNGSSASAAHVSGCAALLLDWSVDNPLPPASVEEALRKMAEDRGDPGWDVEWGTGVLDCFEAVHELDTGPQSDLGFDMYMCRPEEDPPYCWDSTEVFPENPMIEEGVPNVINVAVTNYGPEDATDFLVEIGAYEFGNSWLDYPVCSIRVPGPLLAGQQMMLSCPYTSISSPGSGVLHACVKSNVIQTHDPNFGNNRVEQNIDLRKVYRMPSEGSRQPPYKLQRLLEFEMMYNTWKEIQFISMAVCKPIVGPPPEPGPCPGWVVDYSDNGFQVDPYECSRIITMTHEALDYHTDTRTQEIHTRVIGTDPQDQQHDLLGFTSIAELACETTDLVFQDKSTFSWAGSVFDICPDVWDVARGTLPIAESVEYPGSGVYSSAICLATDLPVTEHTDGTTPGTGECFYYLTRAGGDDPGSWDNGYVTGHRDYTLTACD